MDRTGLRLRAEEAVPLGHALVARAAGKSRVTSRMKTRVTHAATKSGRGKPVRLAQADTRTRRR